MQEVGIEGPLMRLPGQKEDVPFYYQHAGGSNPGKADHSGNGLPGSQSTFLDRRQAANRPTTSGETDLRSTASILRHRGSASSNTRNRGESISAMSKRVDFSLGMKDISSGDMMGDLYQSVSPTRVSGFNRSTSSKTRNASRPTGQWDDHQESAIDRTTSRVSDNQSRFSLNRTSTESRNKMTESHPMNHRNRFFSRRTKKENRDDEYDDLMEQGMADIPESAATLERIDPRSGVVSSQALRSSTESNLPKIAYSNSESVSGEPLDDTKYEEKKGPMQKDTEAFELRNMYPKT